MKNILEFIELFVGAFVTFVSFSTKFTFPLLNPMMSVVGIILMLESVESISKRKK